MSFRVSISMLLLFGLTSVATAQPAPRGDQPGGAGPAGAGPQENVMFNAIDADGDGAITARELRPAVAALKRLDVNGDEVITRDEVSPQGGPGGDPGGMVDRLMVNDANGDGKLTENEVAPEVGRMLTGADLNGDHAIDRAELARAIQSAQGAAAAGGAGVNLGGASGGFGGATRGPDDLAKQLLGGDQNGDGMLSPQEVPPRLMGSLRNADKNGDGLLNAAEVRQAMEDAQMRRQMALEGQDGARRGPDRDPRKPPRPQE